MTMLYRETHQSTETNPSDLLTKLLFNRDGKKIRLGQLVG